MSRTFVVAEAGSCHDGEFWKAARLVHLAASAGADACKFQYWSSAGRLAERRNAAEYFPVYFRYKISPQWLDSLSSECNELDIEFMCTVYLPEDIPVIAPWVKRFKVASFEAGDSEFIRAHYEYNKEVIISTGMTTSEWMIPYRFGTAPISLLHCVSSYPCPPDQANLGVLGEGSAYDGYSDHTNNVLTGALAVAAGAQILEVHFRLDDTDPQNPDYATALSPGQLKDYIALVRQAEAMMGDGIKKPQPAEEAMMRYRVKG